MRIRQINLVRGSAMIKYISNLVKDIYVKVFKYRFRYLLSKVFKIHRLYEYLVKSKNNIRL